ncbi:hypothetical protein Curi_c17380 [Gottschalkia acidurici 9a]|uniref:DUF5714 domain-containing protein n=1 Tax=Gottschalkia acidurici (strain ATCC 7906 / DSM 604 / BCRC 14475 / CIP 104303 / KCTC 5404 / NCIMB 10678 / 9a) TaxID=1128398 RepID=K0B1A2_GOTA9|nr:DUF5714 domain-containing protein [Gottschalkia acidurici]AFS78745.1 hypothetical protein Curi_c17380 [Gottschalkia acidurici 9a]
MEKHNVNCMICGEELEYKSEDKYLKCMYCAEEYKSNVSCKHGHYVCDNCHSEDSIELIYNYCLTTNKANPIEMSIELMQNSRVNMHGPEHHFLVPAVLLSSYCNASGKKDIKEEKLKVTKERAEKIPGGICGNYGSCGVGVGTGLFISVITEATPLTEKNWGLANEMTGNTLISLGKIGGPRCCKRNSFIAINEASKFLNERFNIKLYDYKNDRVICKFKKIINNV